MQLPTCETEVYRWITVLTAIYLTVAIAVAIVFQYIRGQKINHDHLALTRVYDATVFSGSVILALGLIFPDTLSAIRDTKSFLVIAAFAGLWCSLKALIPGEHL
jgi:hypothetical protein